MVQAASEGRELGLQIVGAASRCALLVIMWRLTQLRRDCEGGVSPSAADVNEAADLRSNLVSLLEATLRSTEEVQRSSFALSIPASSNGSNG